MSTFGRAKIGCTIKFDQPEEFALKSDEAGISCDMDESITNKRVSTETSIPKSSNYKRFSLINNNKALSASNSAHSTVGPMHDD